MLEALKNRNFSLHLISAVVSGFGDIISSVAIMLYTLSYTDSFIWSAISLCMSYIPSILFSNMAGALADKINNKKVMLICDLLNVAGASLMALIVLFRWNLIFFLAIAFFMNTLDTFFSISSASLLQQIVHKDMLLKSKALSNSVMKMANLLCTMLGGIMCIWLGYSVVFISNAASFLISFFIVALIRYQSVKQEKISLKTLLGRDSWTDFRATFKLFRSYRFLFYVCVTGGTIINFFLAPLSLYIPAFTKIQQLDYSYYGILMGAISIGNIIFSIIAPKIKVQRKLLISIGFTLQGVSLILFGLSGNFPFAFFSLMLYGCSLAIVNINLSTLALEQIPNEIYGRMAGVGNIFSSSTIPLGYLFGGFILDYWSLPVILSLSGIFVLVAALYSYRFTTNTAIGSKLDSTSS